MMEKIEDLKYPYGNFARFDEKIKPNMKKIQSLLNGGTKIEGLDGDTSQNYGLRENPKKTLRGVDQNFPLPQEKVCKQCGKVFQSMKALCGHMAFHSERKVAMESDSDTEFEGRKKRIKEKGKRHNKISTTKCSSDSLAKASSSVSQLDEKEQEEIAICLMMLSRDYGRCRSGVNLVVVESSGNDAGVLETKSRSNEMRNTRIEGLNCVHKGDEVLDMDKKLNYRSSLDAEMVKEDNSDSGYFLDDVPVRETERGVKIQGYRTEFRKESTQENRIGNGRIGLKTLKNEAKKRTRELADYDDDKLVVESYNRIKYGSAYAEVLNTQRKKSTYECCNCKKSFKSFQALGGHRPCYKRINVDDGTDQEPIVKSEEYLGNKKGVSQEVTTTNKAVKKVRSKKQKGHVCPFCDRVFKSGQALGGHKRSHFIGSNAEISIQSPETKPIVHDLFDLNLPAPQEEDDNNPHFALW